MRRKPRSFQIEKHHRDKSRIRSIGSGLRGSFDKAYEIAKSTIQKEKKQAKEDYDNLNEKMLGLEFTEDNPPSPEALKLFEEWGDRAWTIDSTEEALLALEEMRVVFLFKTVEIAIKEMVAIAFPKLNSKDLYRWESVTTHLKANGITIGEFTGYRETNALRIVNNNIKHSPELNPETKNSIPYWNDEVEFTDCNLGAFCEHVMPRVIQFIQSLGEAIINAAYEFDDSKLEAMASEISDKLSSNQAAKLIERLRAKYKDLA